MWSSHLATEASRIHLQMEPFSQHLLNTGRGPWTPKRPLPKRGCGDSGSQVAEGLKSPRQTPQAHLQVLLPAARPFTGDSIPALRVSTAPICPCSVHGLPPLNIGIPTCPQQVHRPHDRPPGCPLPLSLSLGCLCFPQLPRGAPGSPVQLPRAHSYTHC